MLPYHKIAKLILEQLDFDLEGGFLPVDLPDLRSKAQQVEKWEPERGLTGIERANETIRKTMKARRELWFALHRSKDRIKNEDGSYPDGFFFAEEEYQRMIKGTI